MRLPKILMVSLLLVPVACGGDDSGDTDGHDTDHHATDHTTGGMTAASMTAADADGASMTAASMTAGSSDDGMGSTGMPPGDSGSSGMPADSSGGPADSSGGGSTTGGGGNQACVDFCADYFEVCGESKANDYGDIATCETTCAGWTPAEFDDCRVPHLAMADGPSSMHCGHANIDGGGQC